jgi:hypothetical protein
MAEIEEFGNEDEDQEMFANLLKVEVVECGNDDSGLQYVSGSFNKTLNLNDFS